MSNKVNLSSEVIEYIRQEMDKNVWKVTGLYRFND